MHKKTMWLMLGLALAALAGCQHLILPAAAPAALSPEERADMQTHNYAGKYDMVFAATIAVLQDLGWRLESVDMPAGIIRASTTKHAEALGPEDEKNTDLKIRRQTIQRHSDVTQRWLRWQELIIHIEPWRGEQVRQRIVMNLRGTLPAMSYSEEQGGAWYRHGRNVLIHAPPEEQSVEILLPEAYRDLFERVEKALRLRQGA